MIDPTQLAQAVARSLTARKAEDVLLLDLSRISSFCDVFVICHATNRRQVAALAEGVVDDLRVLGVRPSGIEGLEAARWVLVDYGDVIVHIFDEPLRGFYDLEGLWADAGPIPVEAAPAAPEAAAARP